MGGGSPIESHVDSLQGSVFTSPRSLNQKRLIKPPTNIATIAMTTPNVRTFGLMSLTLLMARMISTIFILRSLECRNDAGA